MPNYADTANDAPVALAVVTHAIAAFVTGGGGPGGRPAEVLAGGQLAEDVVAVAGGDVPLRIDEGDDITVATLLLTRSVPVKVVSEMLGHANVGITLSIYGHVLPHMQNRRRA